MHTTLLTVDLSDNHISRGLSISEFIEMEMKLAKCDACGKDHEDTRKPYQRVFLSRCAVCRVKLSVAATNQSAAVENLTN